MIAVAIERICSRIVRGLLQNRAMNKAASRIPQGLLLGPLLGISLLVLSYLRLAGDTQSPLFEHAAFKAVFEGGPIMGTRLATLVGWFVAAQLLLHVVFGAACCLLAHLTLRAFPTAHTTARALTALWFVLAAAALMLWNAGHYPHSALGAPYEEFARRQLLEIAVYTWFNAALWFFAGVVALFALVRAARTLPFNVLRRGTAWSAIPLIAVASAAAWPESRIAPPPTARPNIIFLGIDSLRYDETTQPGEPSHTRNLDAFLEDAVRLDNSLTPLARTFPSWVAMLTGRHPHSTGAILNLLPNEAMHRGATLPEILRENGYHTAYAIDEVRFSNIDESYGFDEVATPGIGSADFILGAASDTPLLNAIVNTRLGKLLFPYSHANRANAHNYDPDSFVARVRDDIEYRSPMFLATHMTLPHWPYRWRDSQVYPQSPDEMRPRVYIDAVRRADQQFGDILSALEAQGVLENAIVIAFSDHGETFGAPDDALTPPRTAMLNEIGAKPGWGHGTTVLSPHQYRVFLAVRAYGPARQFVGGGHGTASIPASLEDLTPTILDMLDLPSQEPMDGLSLLPELQAGSRTSERLAQRVRFTETEFNPLNLAKMAGGVAAAVDASSIADAARYYRVDPDTDRLEMKTRYLETLKRNRQFAAVGWTQMIGAFPQPLQDSYVFLMVDLAGSLPRRVQAVSDLQRDPEAAELWRSLCARYGAIINSGAQTMRCQPLPVTAAK